MANSGKLEITPIEVEKGGNIMVQFLESNGKKKFEDYKLLLNQDEDKIEFGPVEQEKDTSGNFIYTWNIDSKTIPIGGNVFKLMNNKTKSNNPLAMQSFSVKSNTNLSPKGTVKVEMEPTSSTLGVVLKSSASKLSKESMLWLKIAKNTNQISFIKYKKFIESVLCDHDDKHITPELSLKLKGADIYTKLKKVTEYFVKLNCDISTEFNANDVLEISKKMNLNSKEISIEKLRELWSNYLGEDNSIPYLDAITAKFRKSEIEADNLCSELIKDKINEPCYMEYLWSYWTEEGGLDQALKHLSRRFQNIGSTNGKDPLAHLDISPLRPINNLFWGYIQDEPSRLNIRRRAYEYDHQYGITIMGKAVGKLRPADSRSNFLESFHNALMKSIQFFNKDDDTTVNADAFPMLNALKEVHMILSEGAGNQFGSLPFTARVEMLIQQYILSRSEMREFLPSRSMVAYPEPWMGQLATMNKLQGWNSTSPLHFYNLATFGEQLLLSIRYANWNSLQDSTNAADWAKYWRPQIQGYIHSYRAVTGSDISKVNPRTGKVDATMPAVLINKQMKTA